MTNLRCEAWVTVHTQTTILPVERGGVDMGQGAGMVFAKTLGSFNVFLQVRSKGFDCVRTLDSI